MRALATATLGLAIVSGACGSDSPTAPSPPAAVVSDAVRDAMTQTIQDEYRAETIYEGVIADFGPAAPFTNVLTAEQRHSTSIAALFSTRGWPVPVNTWRVATVPHFPSIPSACGAGVTAEQENIAIYDRVFALDLPADVRRVFENNRAASQFNHLPAFQRCAG
jgi:hypothetical protein